MKMTSLAKKYSDLAETKPSGADTDEYFPTLYFDEAQMDALGIDTAKVGTDMSMVAIVRVSSVSDSKNGSRSIGFEIIEAAIKPKERDAASILFPNEKSGK
ncbi:hypothetical protein HB779_17380 [Phyllobacterium sp. 628]|uniref:hypothetical protein n=1 Tax=Phyllobacterium sp. 628 TaxID=2718938 RepID=UPI0016624649|nr:hypothetical protein [Phyllobacterium sp. 628]QND53461.1 hypothetical protein HB779_17380 [Phyllobacterium sp. 628]